MKTLKDMTTEELKDYSRRMSNLNKKIDKITDLVTEFFDLYIIRSKENNKRFIAVFEKYVDSYETEAIELNFETEFAKIQRNYFIPLMKHLAGLD